MAQLDLGRATLRIRHSQLQLHIAATAHFKQIQSNSSMGIQDGLSQLPDLEGVWVTEAPEMELRFFLSSNWALKNAVDTLVSGLGNKLCGLKVSSGNFYSVLILISPSFRFGRTSDSRLGSRVKVTERLILLEATVSNLACTESIRHTATRGDGLCPL